MKSEKNAGLHECGRLAAGDVTTWLYDIASGSMTNKVYADGKGPTYNYTPDGKLSRRTWVRGIVTEYSYDNWGSLTNTVYSDNTPTVSLAYDALGRQAEARDAAGVTTFLYDTFGSLTNETVIGVAGTSTIIRHWDNYGRSLGYSLVGLTVPSEPHCQSTLAYDPATGRLASMQIPSEQSNNPNNQTIKQFSWNYLPGSDLKSSLEYPNGLTASWQYDANSQLLQVCNAFPTNVISQYDYTYDAAGRRVACGKSGSAFAQNDTLSYGYNEKSELTNAVAAVDSDYRYAYDFDDIGNRETSSERGTNSTYEANNLNQYTLVGRGDPTAPQEEFVPQFDDDGNQTLIKTSTGIWSVAYNGENRPTLWTIVNSSTPTLITMSFDRMGRRLTKNEWKFVYDGYLQIADNDGNAYIWDPAEKVATRPLVWNINDTTSYYTHDGNKNVSEVVEESGEAAAHYEYAPFGTVTAQCGTSTELNPWRYSSEWFEEDVATVYYNYRHCGLIFGRWFCRDFLDTHGGLNLVSYCMNDPINHGDILGLRGNDPPNSIDTGIAAPPIVDKCDVLEATSTFTEFNKYFEVWTRVNFRVDFVSPDGSASGYGYNNFQLTPNGPSGILVGSYYAWLSYENSNNRGLRNNLRARREYKCEIKFKACCKRELDKTTYIYSGELISSTYIRGLTDNATDKERILGMFSQSPDEYRYEDASFVPNYLEYNKQKNACETKAVDLKFIENIRFEYTDSEIYNLFK